MSRVFRSASLSVAIRMSATALAVALAMVVTSPVPDGAAAPPPMQFLANLNSGQETPPNSSNGFGVAHLTFDGASKMLCVSASYSGLGSAEVAAHIHGPALPGEPANILFPLDIGSPKSQCVGPLNNTQKAALLKKQLYINIHTANNPDGEIRGQILRVK
jgi:hypothetical protein